MSILSKTINSSLKDLNPSSEQIKKIEKLLPKKRDINGYEIMPEDILLSAIKTLE